MQNIRKQMTAKIHRIQTNEQSTKYSSWSMKIQSSKMFVNMNR